MLRCLNRQLCLGISQLFHLGLKLLLHLLLFLPKDVESFFEASLQDLQSLAGARVITRVLEQLFVVTKKLFVTFIEDVLLLANNFDLLFKVVYLVFETLELGFLGLLNDVDIVVVALFKANHGLKFLDLLICRRPFNLQLVVLVDKSIQSVLQLTVEFLLVIELNGSCLFLSSE